MIYSRGQSQDPTWRHSAVLRERYGHQYMTRDTGYTAAPVDSSAAVHRTDKSKCLLPPSTGCRVSPVNQKHFNMIAIIIKQTCKVLSHHLRN